MTGRYRVATAVWVREVVVIAAAAAAVPWIYEHSVDNSARFVLGVAGNNPLVCVGLNPSTAAPGALDPTVTKVSRFAEKNGFDGWVMLNLYPQRSTDPDGLHLVHEVALAAENQKRIVHLINGRKLTIVAAWGNLIESRPYLVPMLADIVPAADASACQWVSIGPVLKTGHPRHPSRAPYYALEPFNVKTYLPQ